MQRVIEENIIFLIIIISWKIKYKSKFVRIFLHSPSFCLCFPWKSLNISCNEIFKEYNPFFIIYFLTCTNHFTPFNRCKYSILFTKFINFYPLIIYYFYYDHYKLSVVDFLSISLFVYFLIIFYLLSLSTLSSSSSTTSSRFGF